MMKRTLSFICLSLPFAVLAQQSEFTVEANASRTLTSTERTLSLKKLNLGDNSTIIIPATMDGWTVTATDATIGQNVKIVGNGANGANGGIGVSGGTAQAPCQNGWAGVGGGSGAIGGRGKNVSLNLKIREIGSLTVEALGGNGGNGGSAGNGGKGGNATCSCYAGKGGNGGTGGSGGIGGYGGTVTINYSKVGNVAVSNSNFIVKNTGGKGGSAAMGGAGGAGGAAAVCTDPKALQRPAGLAGLYGAAGKSGVAGQNGITTIKAL